MKKSLVTLAVLGSFAGVASAATSVTLYGNLEAGYQYKSSKTRDGAGVLTTKSGAFTQVNNGGGADRFGLMGNEDIADGLSATFKLEAQLIPDNGTTNATRLFHRESTVGLKGDFGAIKFGRALNQTELATAGLNGAHGANATAGTLHGSAVGSNMAYRMSNGAFYEYSNSGVTFGANIGTEQNSSAVEGTNEEIDYGFRLGYAGNGITARLAYQTDYATYGNEGKGVIGALAYNFTDVGAPIVAGIVYSRNEVGTDTYARTTTGAVRGFLSPNDSVYALFVRSAKSVSGAKDRDAHIWGLGYEHKLSKRTAVFTDIQFAKVRTATSVTRARTYGIGIGHGF